jgi:hypothetical protein
VKHAVECHQRSKLNFGLRFQGVIGCIGQILGTAKLNGALGSHYYLQTLTTGGNPIKS